MSILLKSSLLIPKSKKEINVFSTLKNKSKILSPKQAPDNILKPELEFKICGSFTQNNNENLSYNCKTGDLTYCNYVPHGLHKYKIFKIDTLTQEITTLTEIDIVVKQRDTEIQQYRAKVPANNEISPKKFNVLGSVFKDFRRDNKPIVDFCFEIDWKKVKINRFMNGIEIMKIKNSVYDNYMLIKSIFIYRMSISKSYPTLGWLGFLDFCNEISVMDNKISIIELEKAFVATNKKGDDPEAEDIVGNNPSTELCRYEFIEILIRLAILKNYTTKVCQSYLAAWGIIRKFIVC